MHLGLTAGPLLWVALAGIWTGNQAFLFFAAVCLVGALVILLGVDNVRAGDAAPRETMRLGNILALAAGRETLVVLAGIALYGAGYGIFLTVLPAFLISVKGFGTAHVGVFFALFYAAISLSQLTGSLSDRFGRRVFMVAGLVAAAAGVGTFAALNQPWTSAVLALASLGLGVFYLSSLAFLNEVAPRQLERDGLRGVFPILGRRHVLRPGAGGQTGGTGRAKCGFLPFLTGVAAGSGADGGGLSQKTGFGPKASRGRFLTCQSNFGNGAR